MDERSRGKPGAARPESERQRRQVELRSGLKTTFADVVRFARIGGGIRLRRYQVEVARAIIRSVTGGLGLSFVVMFPRQSGKNELQAQIEAFLLILLNERSAEIVKISPTWKPQSLNAMRRLERVLENSARLFGEWTKENGYIYRVGKARIYFLSGDPEAHIVGATASTLLEVDEAQDVRPSKYDRDIAPMAASTNATRVFWGTAWTSRTLLARELRAARRAEQRDGRKRTFVLDAQAVAAEVPEYGTFVAEQVARLGRTHPMVRTQFYSEEIEAEGGMFPAARQALMQGEHERQTQPASHGRIYALLLDVAGEDEGASGESGWADGGEPLANPRRDSTALTVVEVDLFSLADPGLSAPTYRVVDRRLWTGVKHTQLYGQITALADHWSARSLVVDATGVGAGLASFLEKALPGRVIPFVFTAASKSKLGWDFLTICDTGRFKDWREQPDRRTDDLQAVFQGQLAACQVEVREGPGRLMSWGVPDGARDPASGQYLHDDLLLSAGLCAALDGLAWYGGGPAVVVSRPDPLAEIDDEGF